MKRSLLTNSGIFESEEPKYTKAINHPYYLTEAFWIPAFSEVIKSTSYGPIPLQSGWTVPLDHPKKHALNRELKLVELAKKDN